MSATLSLDYESFREVDLKPHGLSRYARDISTEVLMCAYSFGSDAPSLWVPAEGQKMPSYLKDGLRDSNTIKRAFNAQELLVILLLI